MRGRPFPHRHRALRGRVLPVVFRSQGARYDVTLIDHITDPYGFNEDASVWPGPFCHPKPPNGVFESEVGGKVTVVGDLFTIGWFSSGHSQCREGMQATVDGTFEMGMTYWLEQAEAEQREAALLQ